LRTDGAPHDSLRRARHELGFQSVADIFGASNELARARKARTLREAVGEALAANMRALELARARRRYKSAAWGFAAALRRRPELAELGSREAAAVVGRLLEELGGWGRVGAADSLGQAEEPLSSFERCWAEIDASPLRAAALRAAAEPIDFPALPHDRAWDGLRRFASVLAHLAASSRDRRFFVSCRAFEAELGVSYKTIANWRHSLVAAQLMREVEAAQTRKSATVYEWLGPLPMQSERAA
jgi:hypothetical protein